MAYGYQLLVYKKDDSYESGEKLVDKRSYRGYSGHAMMDEIFSLQRSEYKPQDGWRLDFEPLP